MLIDEIIPEPLGGAHRNIHDTVYNVERYVVRSLAALRRMKTDDLLEKRYNKLRAIGTDPSIRLTGTTHIADARKSTIRSVPGKARPVPSMV